MAGLKKMKGKDSPVVRLGPGGDYTKDIKPSDLKKKGKKLLKNKIKRSKKRTGFC